ncbi:MAG: alpha/beta hydrolase [Pseudomonas sp.]|uniref:alpha/beta hydrolase n=1 Tax=Pseudomonas sp. TaxID=306 RepID=UPI0027336CE7|nr:alpha/beta fold hydrolase [Pseudomonas sp.]MDP3848370.1 alpha/beta hydrolase [Pseudomonas sp.]
MSKTLAVSLLIVTALLAAFCAGPRVEVTTQLKPLQLPADLDRYLADSEAHYPEIIPGTEKTIVWAHPDQRKTPLSVIYLHGFSATRQETAPLSDQVAKRLGANLFYTRLSGHGRGGAAMSEASVNDWLNDSQEALQIGQQLGERVLVIATSTGATLATWLATQPQSQNVLAYVLISPNFAPKDRAAQVLTWPWAKHFAPLLIGPEHHWQPRNAAHAQYWTHRFPTQALLPMMGLVAYVRELPVEAIHAPLLQIYSPEDKVVSPAAGVQMFARFGSSPKKLLALADTQDDAHHVLAGDVLSPRDTPRIEAAILQFLQPLLNAQP